MVEKDLALCNTERNPLDQINCLTFWGQYISPVGDFFTTNLSMFVNCSGLTKSHTLERTRFVLSFLMFKAMRMRFLKLSKFLKPKEFRLMTLMRLFVASSLVFE